jgi:hypothetical protein
MASLRTRLEMALVSVLLVILTALATVPMGQH